MKFKCEAFGGKIFEGIKIDETWNGWECPAFEKKIADEIMAHVNNDPDGVFDGEEITFHDNEKGGYYVSFYDDCSSRYDAMVVDGKIVYPLGAGDWDWELSDQYCWGGIYPPFFIVWNFILLHFLIIPSCFFIYVDYMDRKILKYI